MKKRLLLLVLLFTSIYADKIKDISNIVGIRENQLMGYGLVIGLDGTGDGGSQFTNQTMSSILQSVNVKVDSNAIKSKNIASVIVTASFPAFARVGDQLDITISSIGGASSLEGGQLLLTQLKAVDGQVYALAQGAVTVGGKSGSGDAVDYHTTVGKVIGGALVEREIENELYEKTKATLSLKQTNLNNAVAVQKALNTFFNNKVATAIDARTIKLERPEELSMVEFLAKVQNIDIDYSNESKIVIDERTGTIVAGIDVTVQPVVITHGGLTIKISPKFQMPLESETNKDIGEGIMIDTQNSIMSSSSETPTVANITRALQKLGQTPKDIVAILLAMKKVGAIRVKIEVV